MLIIQKELILNNNTCKYYNRQSLPEYKNKNYKKLYNVNCTQSKNHKNKYFYTYDSDTSLTDANVTKKISYAEIVNKGLRPTTIKQFLKNTTCSTISDIKICA